MAGYAHVTPGGDRCYRFGEYIPLRIQGDKRGEIGIIFRVGTEPGFNTVRVTVDGVGRDLKFQAMSMS